MCMLQGRQARRLATCGHMELIYGALGDDREDESADQNIADIICNTARACGLLIL